MTGYRSGPWPGEDGGPHRPQLATGVEPLASLHGRGLQVVTRMVPAATMAVTRDPGELYLLRHTGGDDAISFVERLDPDSLESEGRSPDLFGGPTWPGSIAAHQNGSIYVVFGHHAHRLGADLQVQASAELPRARPYNGFVVLPDGHLVTKDFAGSRPGHPVPPGDRQPCELVVLEPETLKIVDRCLLAEPSIARLSALGNDLYVVGDTSLLRARWEGGRLRVDDQFRARYRTEVGQTYGWDCVLALGAAWFMDNGEGSENYDGSLRGHGVSTAPLHLVRVDLGDGSVSLTEVDSRSGGLIANPPLIDVNRRIAVGFDSGNGIMQAFNIGDDGGLSPRWRRDIEHGVHLLLASVAGHLVAGDYDRERGMDQVVVLDIDSGDEVSRADTGSPVQSVVFHAVGSAGEVFYCSFLTISRLSVTA